MMAETAELKAKLEETEAELARARSTIMLGARQSEAFTKVLKKSRAEAAEDRKRAAKQWLTFFHCLKENGSKLLCRCL